MRITSLLLILTLAACGSKKPAPGDAPVTATAKPAVTPSFAGEAPTVTAKKDWTPDKVEIRCGGNTCPAQVGVLLFVESQGSDGTDLRQCTASLIAPTRILTTGHCGVGIERGFFVSGTGSAKQTRAIKALVSRTFTPAPDGDGELKQAAMAVYELAEPITNVKPMTIASGPQRLYDRLTAYAMTETIELDEKGEKKGLFYRLDAVTCHTHRHESVFPFALRESPELIYAFDCRLVHGNSGAPLVAPGSEEIQAVQQGIVDQDSFSEAVLKQLGRALVAFEKHDYLMATNVRCVAWPEKAAEPCVKAGEKEAEERWLARQNAANAAMLEREFAPGESGLQFRPAVYLRAYDPKVFDREYDIVHLPKCRTRDIRVGETLQIPNEDVVLAYDTWAEPNAQARQTRMISATVTAVDATGVTVRVSWPRLFGRMAAPADHPSVKWGQAFHIALPMCQGY